MAIATKSYNPGFLTDAELEHLFCVRMAEFESLIETLRENTGNSNQHAIVIGPRGSGKTTLLLRVGLEVRSNPELSSRLFPIVLGEESYGVSTCGEFWLECLSRLSEQVPQRDGEPDLRRTLEDVRRERDDRLLRERCLGALLELADREGKRLVLGVENLNMMFSDMMDPDAGWCLRKTLQTEPRIMMIGTATSRFGEIDRPDRALYDLFRVLQLRPLDRNESAVLCERVAGRPLEAGAVRRLQILTGGSPRLLAIMARFASERSFHTLMADLLGLVDEHTAYFKSHLESLPAQERRVYLALAALWKPATAREVAERARTETSKCSAQLKRLIGRGVVEVAGGTSRRKQYYVSERLYNVYYLLRRSRGTDGLVGALVEFMDAYYSRSELEGLVDQMAEEVGTADSQMGLLYKAALDQLGRLPRTAWHFLRNHPRYLPDEVKRVTAEAAALFGRGAACYERGDFDAALRAVDDFLHRFGTSEVPTATDAIATALVNRGSILARLNRHEEAIIAFDQAVERLRSAKSGELRTVLVHALTNKAASLDWLGRIEDAIAASDDLIRRYDTDESLPVVEVLASARLTRGTMFGKVGRHSEELDAYDEIEHRFGSSESIPLLVTVAKALANKAGRLSILQRWEESMAVCDLLAKRFGEHASGSLSDPVVRGLIIKGTVLGVLGRVEDQLAACEELFARLDRHDKLISAAAVRDHDKMTTLTLRLQSHEIRMYARIAQGAGSEAVRDIQAILEILPRLGSVPHPTIESLMAASLAMGFDRVAALIRESPSADRLLALTTALELEMGLQPRVAIEVQEVAEDIRRDLALLRKQHVRG